MSRAFKSSKLGRNWRRTNLGPYLELPGDSYVVLFRLRPAFFLGMIIYYPKRNYIGVSRYLLDPLPLQVQGVKSNIGQRIRHDHGARDSWCINLTLLRLPGPQKYVKQLPNACNNSPKCHFLHTSGVQVGSLQQSVSWNSARRPKLEDETSSSGNATGPPMALIRC